MAELNLRSVVDEITLEFAAAGQTVSDLAYAISGRALAHIQHLLNNRTLVDGPNIELVVEEIVVGVLKRLLQIAESGAQIGNA